MTVLSWFGHGRWRRLFASLALVLTLAATPVPAATPGTALIARSAVGRYWSSFQNYWANVFHSQSAVVLAVLGTGAVSLVIITRGKWRK